MKKAWADVWRKRGGAFFEQDLWMGTWMEGEFAGSPRDGGTGAARRKYFLICAQE
jgi:hypothetical protein